MSGVGKNMTFLQTEVPLHQSFFSLNTSVALKNKLQTCWLLKKYIYIHTKKIGFLSIQTVRWYNERYADLVHMPPDKSRTHGRKHVPFVHVLFLLCQKLCPFISNQTSSISSMFCYVLLATLAGLHNHIGQLLHLEVRRIGIICKCCLILDGLSTCRSWSCYLMLPAHVVQDGQWLQCLGNTAGLSRSPRVVMFVQGQDLFKRCKKL